MSLVALQMLAMEVAPLVRDLGHWEPLGMLVEQLLGSVQGTDGMTAGDVHRLRSWQRRWGCLVGPLRAFYIAQAPEHISASVALWHLLEGAPTRCQPGTLGHLHSIYRDENGHDPPWSLIPRVP